MVTWCCCFLEDEDDSQSIPDVAVAAPVPHSIGSEFRDIVRTVRVDGGPHGRATLRNRRGHIVRSFYSIKDAHAWLLNDCPNWRGMFLSVS
jgi:hypothetical protein